jgi:hypothetical protein
LVDAFNQTFADRRAASSTPCAPTAGICGSPPIPACAPTRWRALSAATSNRCCPTVRPERRWHALLTEAQMLLHAHPVNRAREDRNWPPTERPLALGRRRPAGRRPFARRWPLRQRSADPRAGTASRHGDRPSPGDTPTTGWTRRPRKRKAWWRWKQRCHDAWRMATIAMAWAEHIAELEHDLVRLACRRWLTNRAAGRAPPLPRQRSDLYRDGRRALAILATAPALAHAFAVMPPFFAWVDGSRVPAATGRHRPRGQAHSPPHRAKTDGRNRVNTAPTRPSCPT